MNNWYELCELLETKPLMALTNREKVKVKCKYCEKISEVLVSNLKIQLKKLNKHLCRSCSNKEGAFRSQAQREKTNLQKYGAKNVMQNKEIQQTLKASNLEKYGVTHHLNKARETFKEKYGKANPMHIPKIKEKALQTSKKYGKLGVLELANQAFKKKYGVNTPFALKEVQEKVKLSNLKKFGVENINQLPENKYKLAQKNMELIGHGNLHRAELLERNECKSYEDFCHKIEVFLEDSQNQASSKETTEKFKCCGQTLISALRHINREDLIGDFNKRSTKEIMILDFIKSVYKGEVISSDRTILKPKELDIYLPELKLAFEFNGVIWHSELFNSDNLKHYHKYKNCLEQGIQLYTIWEHELKNPEKLFQFIKNLITPKEKIYARACKIIQTPELQNFIENNHLQANKRGSIYYGLEYKGEIVMAISIGKHHRGLDQWVLNRVCFSKYQVTGGLERLINAFSKDYLQVNELFTWSDNRYSPLGGMYKNSGFELQAELRPDYFYINNKAEAFSKQSQAKKISKCPANLTEKEWATQRGLHRIWDCGKKRWKKDLTLIKKDVIK